MKPKSLICICSLVALCLFSSGEALLTETNDLAHAFTYLEEDTLFVFDLDNTLIETMQHLGSDQWFSHSIERSVKEEGMSLDEALERIAPIYHEIIHRTEMRLVDAAIPDLLSQMQEKNVPMIGLTKRNPRLSDRTLKQIAPLNIDFSKTAHIDEDLNFHDLNETMLKKGIIFVDAGVDKGPALLAYLNKLKVMPKRIVFIDDKLSHIQNVSMALEPFDIHFVGIRFGGADEKVRSFNPKIADLQLEHFHRILSDEQALHLLNLDH
jgi:phosphoglycolate phosphatase-like HAD superfamily hydrolase